jgi:hypothetical protein
VIAAPPPALSVSPVRIALSADASRELRVTNAGRAAAAVEVERAGFALDLRGRPKIVRRPDAPMLTVSPRRLVLRAGETVRVTVSSVRGRQVAPGDHFALVLLTTRPVRGPAVYVRVRLGVLVVVRVPGKIVHRMRLIGVRAVHGRVEVRLANRGNVVERVHVVVRTGERVVARARRELLPRSKALLALRAGAGTLEVRSDAGVLRRTLRIRR